MTNLIAKCHEATDSLPAAVLLMRIGFWMPKATIKHGGELWIANSHAQWCAETKLSPKQCKTALARLRERRLVITERHMFCNLNVTHLRLTEYGRRVVDLPPLPDQAACPGGAS